jgi:hypothetical protein
MLVAPAEEAIEIDLAAIYRVRISGSVDAQAMRHVIDVLDRPTATSDSRQKLSLMLLPQTEFE